MGSGLKRTQRVLQETVQGNQSPSSITFGKIKAMNQSEENMQRLLKKLDCRTYEEAASKIERVNKASAFLERVRHMISNVAPDKEPNLHNSWKIIKDVVTKHENQKLEQQS